MTEVTKDQFYAHIESLGLDRKKDAIPAAICEPPVTTYQKDGKTIACAKWYDGTAYHDYKQPAYFIAP